MLNSLCAQLQPLRQLSSTIPGKVFSSLWNLNMLIMDSKEFKTNPSFRYVWLFHRLFYYN